MMIKVFATGITLGAGGNGGNFAPSLFVGSYLGYVFQN
jgi:CIC family chloride channel protein